VKTYISDFVTNTSMTSFFLLSDVVGAKTKNGKDYLKMRLSDKTGEVDAKMWDPPAGVTAASFKKGAIVKVHGDVSEWLDKHQVSVKQMREVVESDSVDTADLFERSKVEPSIMWDELVTFLDLRMTAGPLHRLTLDLLNEWKELFMIAPAAKRVHHNYVGGLLEHTLSLSRAAMKLCEHYSLNIDLMLMTCVLHDMGKVLELSFEDGPIGYTTEGTLIGHIPLIMDLVSRAMDGYEGITDKLRTEVLHMIASHHGLLEWGSPKVPMMKEAIVFHFLDMIDSRLAIFDRAVNADQGQGEFTGFISEIGGPLYKLVPGV
jgi:3'-5' exoribonuclease